MAVPGETPNAAAAPPPRPAGAQRRWLRWSGWAAASLLALVGLVFGLLLFIGRHLDHPWIKTRLLALARESAGLDVDYAGLELSPFAGLRARSFSIYTPASLAAGAEKFLQVRDLDLRVRPWQVVFGERRVALVHVGEVELSIVADTSGRTTLTELFPERPEPEPAPPTRLSQSLAGLPAAVIDRLEVGAMRARWVELSGAASASPLPNAASLRPERSLELGSFVLEGSVRCGERGLEGTQLGVHGAAGSSLVLQSEQERRRAALELNLLARGAGDRAIALEGRLAVLDQDLAPDWPRAAELLALAATLQLDAAAGRTVLELPRFEALGRALSLQGRGDLFDAGPPRGVVSGTARVRLGEWPPAGLPQDSLPAALASLALGSFELDAAAEALSWDETGAGGTASFQGALRGFRFDDAGVGARLDALSAQGRLALEGRGGRVQAELTASPVWRTPSHSGELSQLRVALSADLTQQSDTQWLDGEARVSLGAGHVGGAAGESLELGSATLKAQLHGSLAELPTRVVPALDLDLALGRLEARAGGRRLESSELEALVSVRHVRPDPSSVSGFDGDAELSFSAGALRVFEALRRAAGGDTGAARRERSLLGAQALTTHLSAPLSLASLTSQLGAQTVNAPGQSLAGLALALEAQAPLGWAPHSAGEAHATLRGSLQRARLGDSRGALEALHVAAQRLPGDVYRLDLDAVAASLVGRGRAIPGRVSTELRAHAVLPEGTLAVAATLKGGPAAPAFSADLDARVEAESGRVSYRAGLAGERLGALARLWAGATPSAASISLGASRLRVAARGVLAGLLEASAGPLPSPVSQPLRRLSGEQALRVELGGLDYHAPDLALAVPDLAFDVESTHRRGGAGSATLRWQASAVSYEGGGSAVRLTQLNHALSTTFERLADTPAADIQSTFELGAATQSWVPGYPVRDLRLVSDLSLDGLSVFMRELRFDNPGGGTSLRAAGALELLGEDALAATGPQPLVGREALSFDGRLQQDLAPLEQAGATARSSGTLALPFRVESGGLLGYRLLATLEAEQVTFATHDGSIAVDELNGVVPIVEEIALLPGGLVMGVSPRSSPLSDARFFDVHPFLAGNNYVTARSIRAGALPAFGPLAANVRLERTGLSIDQLQVGYSGGQIVGQARIAYRDGDPVLRLRLNATGLRSARSEDVFDANATLSFEPVTLTLDGKLQIVRASSGHVLDMLDMIDPYRESTNANRVRSALALGYPKFVRFKLHDGTVDAKVELGGLAQLVRLDEIKAIPLGPVLQRYVAPAFEGLLPPRAAKPPPAGLARAEPKPPGAAGEPATPAGPEPAEPAAPAHEPGVLASSGREDP